MYVRTGVNINFMARDIGLCLITSGTGTIIALYNKLSYVNVAIIMHVMFFNAHRMYLLSFI